MGAMRKLRWRAGLGMAVLVAGVVGAAPQERPDRAQAAAETAAALAHRAEREQARQHAARIAADACERGARYVQASVAMLHEKPDPASQTRAQLPIGTQLEGGCDEDGWTRVWAQHHSGVIGWVRSDLLGAAAPTVEALRKDYVALPAADRAGRRLLGERALALAPFDERAHRLHIDALREAGDTEALAQAELALATLRKPQVSRETGEPRLIFAYDGQLLSPLAELSEGGLQDGPYTAGDDSLPVGDPRRVPAYFRPGRVYHYYRRGIDAGLLRVLGKTEPSCESDVALAQRVGAADDTPPGAGIVANFPLRPLTATAEAEPDAKERALLERLLRKELRGRGLPPAKVEAAMVAARAEAASGLQFAAARSQRQGPRVLIATLYAYLGGADDRSDDPQAEVYAMLIVESDGKGGHRVAHRDAAVGEGGESSRSQSYLDHLDLDGDGRSELIFIGRGYESWRYQVWRRGEREWSVVASGGGGGC